MAGSGPVPALVTQSVISSLNKGGSLAVDGIQSISKDNLRQYIYEICWAVLKKEMSVTKLPSAIKACCSPPEECGVVLGTVFWMLWMEIGSKDAGLRARLVRCVEEALKNGVVSRETLLETEETELLEEAGLIANRTEWDAKEAMIDDRLTLPPDGRLLLSEEARGYSELASLLLPCSGSPLSSVAAREMTIQLESLMGEFELDPDRVLSCVLDTYELAPDNDAYLGILQIFDPAQAVQVLGFKFQTSYGQKMDTPGSLFALSAVLVQHKAIPLDALFAHLGPSNEDMASTLAAVQTEMDKTASNIGVINLASTTATATANTANQPLDLDGRTLDTISYGQLESGNQKISLLAEFLKTGNQSAASRMMQLLKPMELQPGIYPVLCNALCAQLHCDLDKIFRKTSANPFAPKILVGKVPPAVFASVSQLGFWIFRDIKLLMKLMRVMRACLTMYPDLEAQVADVLATAISPAATLFPANPAIASELWQVLDQLPYPRRFKTYANIKRFAQTQPVMKAAARKATIAAKRILKKLHVPQDKAERKKKLRPLGRNICKIGQSVPLPVMDAIISQIESFGYNSIGEPILESLKYLTPMAYDAMTFVVLDRLTMMPSKRRKMKEDGINLSDWLTNLAELAGEICKSFLRPTEFYLDGAQYVLNQLKQQEGADLQVLKEIIAGLTGIITVDDLNENQVEALAGGETLRHETITLSTVPRNRRVLQKGARRLLAAIQKGAPDEQVLMPLVVMSAQQRSICIINSPYGMPLKGIGELYDKAQQTFCQYVEFLQSAITDPIQYAKLLPSMEAMHSDYRLDPEVVFALWRPALQVLPRTSDPGPQADQGEDEEMEEGEAPEEHKPQNGTAEGPSKTEATARDVDITWADVSTAVKAMLPASAWNAISPELYTTFWTYSIYDIHMPKDRYLAEQKRLQTMLKQKETLLAERSRMTQYQRRDDRDGDDEVSELKKEKKMLEETIAKLQEEMSQQSKHVKRIHAILRKEKDNWFKKGADAKDESGSVMVFIQHCIVPRVMFSPADALYCCKFAVLLLSMDTPYFSCLVYYDKVLKLLVNRVISTTDREALNLGVFLRETLGLLEKWRSDEEMYVKQCSQRLGFRVKLHDPSARIATFEEFRKVTNRWQQVLCKSFQVALYSGEYTQIRAALLVLIPFPALQRLGTALQKAVKRVVDNETHEDLKTLANSYYLQLDQQIKTKMVNDEEYGGSRRPSEKQPPPGKDAQAVAKAAKLAPDAHAKGTAAAAAPADGQAPPEDTAGNGSRKQEEATQKKEARAVKKEEGEVEEKTATATATRVEAQTAHEGDVRPHDPPAAVPQPPDLRESKGKGDLKPPAPEAVSKDKTGQDSDHKGKSDHRTAPEAVSKGRSDHRTAPEAVSKGRSDHRTASESGKSSKRRREDSSDAPKAKDVKSSKSRDGRQGSRDESSRGDKSSRRRGEKSSKSDAVVAELPQGKGEPEPGAKKARLETDRGGGGGGGGGGPHGNEPQEQSKPLRKHKSIEFTSTRSAPKGGK